MKTEAIYHRTDSQWIYPTANSEILFRIRTFKNDIKKVFLKYTTNNNFFINNNRNYESLEMTFDTTRDMFNYYEVTLNIKFQSIVYFFQLIDHNDNELFYGNETFHSSWPSHSSQFFISPKFSKFDIFETPDWADNSIIYSIFPDRFNIGRNKHYNKTPDKWNSSITDNSYLGGNLRGIINKLDYLEDLGINAIYLNPIFRGDSLHKYDTCNYYEIDPMFGTIDDLKELINKSHNRGIKIILDIVMNHCGLSFPPFKDALKNRENSRYYDWFIFNTKENLPPYEYFNVSEMPKINNESPEVTNYFLNVVDFWVNETAVDGFRFDVSDGINTFFIKVIRDRIKEINSEILVVGDIFHSAHPWLDGQHFDTNMNYLFYEAIKNFVAYDHSPDYLAEKLNYIKYNYKKQVYNKLWNLIDSHDTPRFINLCNFNHNKFKIAIILQFTLPGSPVIFYGDEVGLNGDKDPECRAAMEWNIEKQENEVFNIYKKIIQIRNENLELLKGNFKIIKTHNDDAIFGYSRSYESNYCEVYINNSYKIYELSIYTNENIIDILNNNYYNNNNNIITITIPSKSSIIIKFTN